MNILVTGGAGYIGNHTVIELVANGHNVVVTDKLINSSNESLRRVEQITGVSIPFYDADCTDKNALKEIFDKHSFDAVIHFAALKAVGESVKQPLRYYKNNLNALLAVCEVMQDFNVKKLIFSSSATVYGKPESVPLREDAPLSATNPYGQTKLMSEQILRDLTVADNEWQIVVLRYFNPVGAHESGLIGEDPNGTPNNLLPYISQVAIGKLDKVRVFGNDYDTPDGTGVRDYIHVVDLAKGHVAAVNHLPESGVATYNLGTGNGVSVLQLIKLFEKASAKTVPYEITERRPGDIASCYADPTKANEELGWKAERTIEQACEDAWRWQSNNPNGYKPN